MVGTTGFEPATSATPLRRATKLRYVPYISGNNEIDNFVRAWKQGLFSNYYDFFTE